MLHNVEVQTDVELDASMNVEQHEVNVEQDAGMNVDVVMREVIVQENVKENLNAENEVNVEVNPSQGNVQCKLIFFSKYNLEYNIITLFTYE